MRRVEIPISTDMRDGLTEYTTMVRRIRVSVEVSEVEGTIVLFCAVAGVSTFYLGGRNHR